MPPSQTGSSRGFSDSRHLRVPTPWPIWFCGQKPSGWRLTEFRSDFYLFLRYSHYFYFRVSRKAKKVSTSDIIERLLRTKGLAFPFGREA
jgi:hypothetical protein